MEHLLAQFNVQLGVLMLSCTWFIMSSNIYVVATAALSCCNVTDITKSVH